MPRFLTAALVASLLALLLAVTGAPARAQQPPGASPTPTATPRGPAATPTPAPPAAPLPTPATPTPAALPPPPPTVAPPPSTGATCVLAGRFVRTEDEQPLPGVFVVIERGGSGAVATDIDGFWTLDAPADALVTLHVISEVEARWREQPFRHPEFGLVNSFRLRAGTTAIDFAIAADCGLLLVELRDVEIIEGPVTRPAPPPLPSLFLPSETTELAQPLPPRAGNAANVPWLGHFWLTVPGILYGICSIDDPVTLAAVETAFRRWQEADPLGLIMVREDQACDDRFPGPKLLVTRATLTPDPALLGLTDYRDLTGNDCALDLRGTTCWVYRAVVALNGPGFDRLTPAQQLATAIHEIGHALGLAHARTCTAETIMWHDDSCAIAPTDRPGSDDLASLRELWTTTLHVIKPIP